MKSKLCYAWFGDEDVKVDLSSLKNKVSTDGSGETPRKAALGHDGHRWEIRHEPPQTQPLFKRP